MMLSLCSDLSNKNLIDRLFDIANKHHKNPEVETDVESLCEEVAGYIEENSNNENFADIILATFDAHKEETKVFAKWVGYYSRAYPGKELQIKGLYEPIHTLLDLVADKVSETAKPLLKKIDAVCAKHAIKIPFPNDILQLILKKHVKMYSPEELKEVKTTSKKFHSISQKHALKHFKPLKSVGIYNPTGAINHAKEKKNIRFMDISEIYFTKDELIQLVKCLPDLNTLIAIDSNLDSQKEKIIVEHLPNLVELALSTEDYKSYKIEKLNHLKNLKYLYLRNNKINDIAPLSPLTNLKKLDLRGNFISQIPQGFSKLTSLEHLDLNATKEPFECTTLKNLTNLRSLNLSDRKLCNMEALSALTNLEKLDLDSNTITDIAALSKLKKLKHLALDNNKLNCERIKKVVLLSNLKKLDLCLNYISQLPEEFSKLSALEDLDLSAQNTESLGLEDIKVLSSLKKLERLNLSECNLNNIKVESFQLPINLKYLNLVNTKIEPKLLEKVSACTNLIELYLSRNQMSSEGIETIQTLSNLKTLDLSRNCLIQIPQEFSSLTALEKLDLNSQKIERREFNCNHISQLKALKSLYLWGNSINPKSLQSLHKLEKLKCLNLSECRLGHVENQIFELPKNLKSLDLNLTEIGPKVLEEINLLKNLKRLNLANCKLGKLCLENLQLPLSLERLVLRYNNLESKCIKSLLSLKNLTHLDIRDKTHLNLEELQSLSTMNLKVLQLSLQHVDHKTFKTLEAFKNLEELTLSYDSREPKALEDIRKLPNLKKSRIFPR